MRLACSPEVAVAHDVVAAVMPISITAREAAEVSPANSVSVETHRDEAQPMQAFCTALPAPIFQHR
jgi:hypothetical protein